METGKRRDKRNVPCCNRIICLAGEVCSGKAWRGMVGHGEAWQAGRGQVLWGTARYGKAGAVRLGELSRGEVR